MSIMAMVAQPIDRHRLYGAAYTLGLANIGCQKVLESIVLQGFLPALANLFGISAFVWVALPALWAILNAPHESAAPDRRDWALFALLALACIFPIRSAAAVMTGLMCLRGLLPAHPREPLFRASLIALSTAAALFWGQALLSLSGHVLLDLDVMLASTFSGLASDGNMLFFTPGSASAAQGKGFIIASACSSLQGISLALLAWVLVTQFYDLPATKRTVACGLLGILATVAVNIARLSAMGHYPAWFEWIHVGQGAAIAGFLALFLVMCANMGGNWHAITRRG